MLNKTKRLAMCPPVLKAQPFGCLVITIDEELSAMFKFDPVLNLSKTEAEAIMNHWRNTCLGESV